MNRHLTHAIRLIRHAVQKAHVGHVPRSPHWPTVEHHFRKANPNCAACGRPDRLQVHHRQPFHLRPELELDPTNLIGLCMGIDCHAHLMLGHGDNFKALVLEVAAIAERSLKARQAGDKKKVAELEAYARKVRQFTL